MGSKTSRKRARSVTGAYDPREIPEKSFELGTTIITIRVGDPEHSQSFAIHENLLSKNSEFFRKALESGFKESVERIVRLPEDSPETFKIYQTWLYTREVRSLFNFELNDGYIDLCRAYVFGDKIHDNDFQDAVIDAIIAYSCELHENLGWYPAPPRVLNFVYRNTQPGSRLRELLIIEYVWCADSHALDDEGDVDKDVLLDLVKALLDDRELPDPIAPTVEASTCKFHVHGKGDCYQSRL